MTLKPGDVVILKSGGQPLTVAEVQDNSATCLWLGEEGELFRETLPSIVLELIELDPADDEDEQDEDDSDEDNEDEQDEDDKAEDKAA
jgi:uncharacterized protein YodC (DUF2158 family)